MQAMHNYCRDIREVNYHDAHPTGPEGAGTLLGDSTSFLFLAVPKNNNEFSMESKLSSADGL